jgi:hypothetical protein
MPIRRIETRSGVRYIENGRFIPSQRGAREFVRENIDSIRENRRGGVRYENLNTRERQSYSAQNRYRYGGQFVRNPFNYLRQFEPTTQGQRDLQNFVTRDELNELERSAFTIPFQQDYNGEGQSQRLRGELTDVVGDISNYLSNGYEFILTTENGRPIYGIDAVDYLRSWEEGTIENFRERGLRDGRELDRIRINYDVRVNAQRRTIEINLNDIDDDRDIEAWFNTP